MRPVLVVNPRSDTTFVDLAEATVEDAMTPAQLEERLRASFPRASVRARALSAEPMVVWYVYRDGQWVSPSETPEPNGDT